MITQDGPDAAQAAQLSTLSTAFAREIFCLLSCFVLAAAAAAAAAVHHFIALADSPAEPPDGCGASDGVWCVPDLPAGHPTRSLFSDGEDGEGHEPLLTLTAALLWLAGITVVVAFLSEYLTGSIRVSVSPAPPPVLSTATCTSLCPVAAS